MRASQKIFSIALAFAFVMTFSFTAFSQGHTIGNGFDGVGDRGHGIINFDNKGGDTGGSLSENNGGHSTGNGLVSIDGIGDRGGGIAKSNNNGTDSDGSLTDNHRGGNGLALVTGDRVGNGIVNRGGEVVG